MILATENIRLYIREKRIRKRLMKGIKSWHLYRQPARQPRREQRERSVKRAVYDQFNSESYNSAPLSIFISGNRAEMTYGELSGKVKKLSDYLIESAVEPGDRIAILSESRPEWGVAFFAAIHSGAIVVPLDVKLTITELVSILSDARPRLLFVSSELAETARDLKEQLPFLESVILIDEETR